MRGWISAELDGELSEFEAVLLHGHLDRCDSCATFRVDAASFTGELRRAPLEQASRPVAVSTRRRLAFQPLRVPAAAALAVVMVALGGLFASLNSSAILRESSLSSAASFDDQDLRQLRLAKQQVAMAQLRFRRAEASATQIVRHTGFQNP